MRCVISILVLLLTAVPSGGAVFVGLGEVPEAIDFASAISDDGVVAGRGRLSGGPQRPVIWHEPGDVTYPDDVGGGGNPQGIAEDVSSDGSVVVGTVYTPSRAFRWTEATGTVDLGVLPGQSYSFGEGVSGDGSTVVGTSGQHAFRWTASGGMQLLLNYAQAHAISRDGQVVVGWSRLQAFRSTWAGIEFLGDLPGGPTGSRAWGVSVDGTYIVGWSYTAEGIEAFLWTEGAGMRSLGDLPGGGVRSEGRGVSADGERVVGFSESDVATSEAFLWTPDLGMRAMKDVLLEDYGIDTPGWTLLGAFAIAPDGTRIAGWGKNPSGVSEGWLAILKPDCSDGFDNDGDGWADSPNDPGCLTADSAMENPECQDGVDNDGAWGIDFDGGESVLGAGSGSPDGPDPQCLGKPWRGHERARGRCGLGSELALVLVGLRALRRRRLVLVE